MADVEMDADEFTSLEYANLGIFAHSSSHNTLTLWDSYSYTRALQIIPAQVIPVPNDHPSQMIPVTNDPIDRVRPQCHICPLGS